ncbi:type 4b pilus protein PilO2 [Cupriavidus necator]|uniref:type 4b pilus protein PilO2 n=1 Tax=Cupriavidus necator TaxID=106590 RepID=UPI003ECE7AA6
MAGIIQLGKRRWVAGMTWASYEDTPNKAELREDAQRLHATWAAVRIGEDCIQGGFCSAIQGVKVPKLYSLAAMLADSRKQPWLGIFKIEEDLWWYVAVRDGHAILPDGDILGGKEEIYAARERHSGYTDWNYVEGDLELLETLIKDVDDGPTRIRSLDGNPHLPKILAGAAIGLLAAGAGAWWLHLQHEQEAAKQRAAMARMREQLSKERLNDKPIVSTPATSMPPAKDFLGSCGDAITLPISQYGWLIDSVSCAVDHASVIWARKDGATIEFRPEGELSDDGEKVTQTISLGLNQQSKDDRIQLGDAAHRLRAWAQAAGFKLDLKPPTNQKPPTLPGADAPAAPPPPPEQGVNISINISLFDLDLPDIPGLRLSTINMTPTGWELTGALYGR